MDHYFDESSKRFRSVVLELANSMQEYRDQQGEGPGVVFLLGAGCSMQYGLPSFRRLLNDIYADYTHQSPEKIWNEMSQDDLRNALEEQFSRWNANKRREYIRRCLPRVDCNACLGYLRLARLRRSGFIRAILNMNFDTLLEEACSAVGDEANVHANVRKRSERAIYKIHGSVREDGGKPTIAIAESDLFRQKSEELATIKLLTTNHVAILGYSGVDAKIAQALQSFRKRSEAPGVKLFVINVSGPGHHLAPAIELRESDTLCVTGPEASFENFMEALEYTLDHMQAAGDALRLPDPEQRQVPIYYFTTAERLAARNCRKLALSIRASINVAEASPIGIIEHGETLFQHCLQLANSAGVDLTPAEKYLALCAGYLHDLGYFLGYSSGKASPGWRLLREHGKETALLLNKHLTSEQRQRITPHTYSPESQSSFIDLLIRLCGLHSVPPGSGGEDAAQDLETSPPPPKKVTIKIHGLETYIRFNLMHALFAAAEELAEGHPFLPSSSPVDPEAGQASRVVEDHILDLYLSQKKKELQPAIEPGQVTITLQRPESGPNANAIWLLTLASRAIDALDVAARDENGRGIKFICQYEDLLQEKSQPVLIERALEESLAVLLNGITPHSVGEFRTIFDLLALYTVEQPGEPRVEPSRAQVVDCALSRVRTLLQQDDEVPQQSVLPLYFTIEPADRSKGIIKAFTRDFQDIIYPAWRFCARNLREGINAISLSRVVLDLGTTPFRSELALSLRHLANEKISWNKEEQTAYGHEGCALCTSRLLYIFSYARLLYGEQEPNTLPANEGQDIDGIVQGLLRFLLNTNPAPNWWGVSRPGFEDEGIHSADYAAWAVRSLAFCLAVDHEVRAKRKTPWLHNRPQVIDLLNARLTDLCTLERKALLSDLSEEPHSYVVGDVAVAFLEAKRLLSICPDVSSDWQDLLPGAREVVKEAAAELDDRNLSLISRLYLWPAKIFLHETEEGNRDDMERELLDLHRRCSGSPIWIPDGSGRGSWGYNVENTQRLVSTLNMFWRYAFENRAIFEPLFERSSSPAA